MGAGKITTLSLGGVLSMFVISLTTFAATPQWQVLKGQFYIQVQTESKVNGDHGFYILCTFVRGMPGAGSPTLIAERPAAKEVRAEGNATIRISLDGAPLADINGTYETSYGTQALQLEDLLGKANVWFANFLEKLKSARRIRFQAPSLNFDMELAVPGPDPALKVIERECVKDKGK